MESKIATMVCGVVVAVLLITTLAVPVIANASQDSGSSEPNPDGHGITLALQTSNFNVNVDYTDNGDDTFTVNGESYDIEPQILFAWNSGVIYIDDDLRTVLLAEEDGSSDSIVLSHFIATIEDTTLVIDDEDEIQVSFDMPSYVYTPDPDGKYSSWSDTTDLKKKPNSMVIAVGSFAGVDCYYNSNNQYVIQNIALGLIADADVTATEINSVSFKAPSEVEEFDPSVITIQPFDPSIINPVNPVSPIDPDPIDLDVDDYSIMVVPTPSFTDGDWGYDKLDGGTKATIVSYSGTGGGDITIPSSVGGLPVVKVGKGGSGNTVFDTSLVADSLIISDGIQIIDRGAFRGCSGFTGSLVIPDSVTEIGRDAFRDCSGFTGSLVIPDSVTSFGGTNAFNGCSGFNDLTISKNITEIPNYTFGNCGGFTGTLVIPEGVTSIGQFAFSSCGGFTGTLVIPEGVTNIGDYGFQACEGLTSLVIPDSVTQIGSYVFYLCSGLTSIISYMETGATVGNSFQMTDNLKEVLNLGSLEFTTTSYGLNADVVQDHIDACSYLAPLEITSGSGGDMFTQILNVVPLLMIIGVLMFVAGFVLYRRM